MNLREKLARLKAVARASTELRAQIYEEPHDQAIFLAWMNPWQKSEEKFASVWWPVHPIEATKEAEEIFESTARHIETFSRSTVLALIEALEIADEALSLIGAEATDVALAREARAKMEEVING